MKMKPVKANARASQIIDDLIIRCQINLDILEKYPDEYTKHIQRSFGEAVAMKLSEALNIRKRKNAHDKGGGPIK